MPEGCAEKEWKQAEAGGDINGPEETEKKEGRTEAGGDSYRPEDVGGDRERQGEAGGDAWHCSLLSAVALAVTHWSHKCYIYQAAV